MTYYLLNRNSEKADSSSEVFAILVLPSYYECDIWSVLEEIRKEYNDNLSSRHWFNKEDDYVLFRLEQKFENLDGFQLIDNYNNVILENFTLVQ